VDFLLPFLYYIPVEFGCQLGPIFANSKRYVILIAVPKPTSVGMVIKPRKAERSSSSDTLRGHAGKLAWGRKIRWRGAFLLLLFPHRKEVLMGLFSKKKKCLRCESKNINVDKPTGWQNFNNLTKRAAMPWVKELKNLNVCRDCGFSWEDR
jgi:hypothetical protein